MGWLQKLGEKVVYSKFGSVMNTASAVFSNPIKSITAIVSSKSTIKDVTTAHFEKPLSAQITKTVLATAGYASVLYAGGAVATKGAGVVAKSLIPATLKGKVIGAVATPLVLGAVIQSPALIGKTLEAPEQLAEFGADLSGVIADPSVEGFIDLAKGSPVITSVIAGGVLGTGALVGANIISGIKTRKAIEGIGNVGAPVGLSGGVAQNPILPETMTVSPTKTQSKRRRATKKQPIKQSVRVNIINRPVTTGLRMTNKRYLNNELLN